VNLTNKGKIATHLARHNRRSSAEKVWLRGREVRYNFGTIEVEIFGRFLGVSDTNETIYVKRLLSLPKTLSAHTNALIGKLIADRDPSESQIGKCK